MQWRLLEAGPPAVDLALFDAGQRRAQVEASDASQRAALVSYDAALQAAFREAGDALAVRDSLSDRLAVQRAQVGPAERSLALVERSYRVGTSGRAVAKGLQAGTEDRSTGKTMLEESNWHLFWNSSPCS